MKLLHYNTQFLNKPWLVIRRFEGALLEGGGVGGGGGGERLNREYAVVKL